METLSLATLQKRAFEAEIARTPSPRHLVVDATTFPLVCALFGDDVLNTFYTFNLIDAETRSKDREQHAVYLLDPRRRYAIECLNADYAHGKRYSSATIMFLPGGHSDPWAYLMQNPHFSSAFSGISPQVCYSLGFVPCESHLYVTGAYPSIPAYYSSAQDSDLREYQLEKAVNSMLSMCVLFNELPVIRYFNGDIAKALASRLQRRLQEYARKNETFNPSPARTVFLITDRTMGMFDALAHWDCYRYFAYDYVMNMELEPGAYPLMTYKYSALTRSNERIENEITFDSNDEIYEALKDKPLQQVLAGLKQYTVEIEKESQRLNQLQELEELEQLWRGGKLSPEQKQRLQELRRVWNVTQTLRDKLRIEHHNQLKSLVNGHINFCNEIKDTKKLAMLREYEAICALHVSAPKEAAHLMSPTEGLIQCLASLSDDDIFDKIRIVLMYSLCRGGIIRADMRKLLMFALPKNVDRLMENLEILHKMGLQVYKDNLKVNPEPRTFFDAKQGAPTPMAAYVPSYANVIEKLATRTLPECYTTTSKVVNGYEQETDAAHKTFPYANAGESHVDQGMSYAFESKLKFSAPARQRPRMYVFAAGGLTAAEISMMGNMEERINHDIYIGTDQVYSVLDMIGDINEMDSKTLQFELHEKNTRKQPPPFLVEATRTTGATAMGTATAKSNGKTHTIGLHHSKVTADAPEKKHRGLFGKLKKLGH